MFLNVADGEPEYPDILTISINSSIQEAHVYAGVYEKIENLVSNGRPVWKKDLVYLYYNGH